MKSKLSYSRGTGVLPVIELPIRRLCLALGVTVMTARVAAAQDVPEDAPPQAGAKYADVYLDDSFEANEMLADARRLAEALRWEEAARLVDRLLARHGDKLVQVSARRFEPIAREVLAWMRTWPADALAAYRALFEETARREFSAITQSRELQALHALVERYFCTRTAIDMGDALAQVALEQGDFRRAARIYMRFWQEHPDAATETPRLASRLALVEALAGNRESAREWTKRATDAGAATIRWMGQDRPLPALIDSLLESGLRPVQDAAAPFEWPVFGGNSARNRIVPFKVHEAASLWRFDEAAAPAAASSDDTPNTGGGDATGSTGMHAIVARDLVIIHDPLQAWAVRLESGKPAWTYAAFDKDIVRRSGRDGLVARWHAPTYADGRVFLCMGSESVPYYGYEGQGLPSTLVCLDAATGRELWRTEQTGLEAAFSRCDLDSTPLVLGDKVFVVVRRRRSFGFEDAYLCRFDAFTGAVEFRTHLGSASTGGFGYRRPTMSVPSVVDGDIVVLTNLGTLARVSPWSGRVNWLTLYDRQTDAQSSPGDSNRWQHNPVFSDGRRLIGLPLDAGGLIVLDSETGELRETVPMTSLHGARSLLGVRDGVLYGVGDSVFAYDLESGQMRWSAPLPQDEPMYARGCLTSDQILVPTRARLHVYSYAGDLLSSVRWEAPEDVGNLVATPDQLLVAARDRLSAYARKQDVWDRLHARMAAAPDDPSPALDLAEVAIRGSDAAEALSALEEAVRRAGGFVSIVDPDLRARVFEDCLALAERVSSGESPDLDLARKLLAYASQCTPDIQADVIYRLRLAAVHLRSNRPDEAVALYQQMLMDRSLREVPITPAMARRSPSGEPRTAGALSRERIEQLITEHGRSVYEAFEARAAQWLEAGVRGNDLALLDRVVESYPNANAAAAALVEGARLLLRDKKPQDAVRRLAMAYARYPARIDAPEVMRLIADSYIDSGRPETAWRWLTRAAREFPGARVSVGGRLLSFEQYREKLGDIRDKVEPSRPRVSLPLKQTFVREFDQTFELLEPFFKDRPGARWDRYYVYSDARLHCFASSGAESCWPEPAACRMKPDLLVATDDQALFATRHQIFALAANDGRVLWKYGKYPADIDDALADHERFDFFRAYGLGDDRLVTVQDDGRLACLALADGQVLWEQPAELRPSGSVAVSDVWTAYAGGHPAGQVLRVLDLKDGSTISSIDMPADRRAERLSVSLEGYLVVQGSQYIAAYDPHSGERIWNADRNRNLLTETVRVDIDGVYFSDDGRHLTKLGPSGRILWQSDPVAGRPSDGLSIDIAGNQIIVSTERRIAALDSFDGRTLWEGALPDEVLLGRRALTDAFMVGVDVAAAEPPAPFKAYFFDHRGGSGKLAPDGGILELGMFTDVRLITLRDNALLLATDRGIHGWHAGNEELRIEN